MKRLRLLVSLASEENDYQRAQAAAARQAGQKYGFEVEVVFAPGDPISQVEQLVDQIRLRQCDVVVCQPAGGTALPVVARAAVEAGMGWVILDSGADYIGELRKLSEKTVFSLYADQSAIGRYQAEQIAALIPDGGTVLYIQGPGISRAAQERRASMKEHCPANVHVLTLRGMGWNERNGYQAVEKWFRLASSRHQQVTLVAAQNDLLAIGARRYISENTSGETRDRWMTVPFLGVDGLDDGGRRWVQNGLLAATVVVPRTTGAAIELLASTLESGRQPPERTAVAPTSWPKLDRLAQRKPF